MLVVSWIFVRFTPFGVDRFFRRAQFVSASFYALGHGGNDAQKTMGIIAVLLYSQGYHGHAASTCRSGWCWPVRSRWRSARWPAAGGS